MLLILIKKRTSRFGFFAELIEKNHLTGDRFLAEVLIRKGDWPLELFYPLTVTRSGIHIRDKTLNCWWPDTTIEQQILNYLCTIQKTGEEIILDVTHHCAPTFL